MTQNLNNENHVDFYHFLDEMTPWNDRLQVLEVVSIIDEAKDVKTFIFRSDAQTWFRYKPGQFITLELPVGEEPLLRTYTLSSSPTRPFNISVTVKAQVNSIGTRWMFDHLKPGDLLKAYGPAGHFTHFNYPAGKYLFISAGSGITPMMSMLRWFYDCAPSSDISFVGCFRRYEDIIFHQELERLHSRMPALQLVYFIKEMVSQQNWQGYHGKIKDHHLTAFCPDFMEREVFCCGPEPFMKFIKTLLIDAGFDSSHYHQESFGELPFDALSEPVSAPMQNSVDNVLQESVTIRFATSEIEGACLPGQTVLQAARTAGVRIPAACENGLCGTCKTKKTFGEVTMEHNGGILDEEINEGYILPCCSIPLTSLEIEA